MKLSRRTLLAAALGFPAAATAYAIQRQRRANAVPR